MRFLQHLDIGVDYSDPMTMFCNNMAALAYAKIQSITEEPNTLISDTTKFRNMVAQKKVVLKHLSTSRMVVDPLIKPKAKDNFMAHVRSLGLCGL